MIVFLLDKVDIDIIGTKIKADNYIYKNDVKIVPYIENDGIVELASIVILCNPKYNIDLFSAIRHELKHLYDCHIKHIKIQNLSTDITASELYMKNKKLRFDTDYFMYSDEKLKYFSENISPKEILMVLLDNMYLLNSSEMSSRLNQFYGYIKRNNYRNSYLYSDVYNEYSRLKHILESIIKYASEESKIDFGNEYSKTFNKIVNKQFGTRHYFANVYTYYVESITKFLDKCASMYIDSSAQ